MKTTTNSWFFEGQNTNKTAQAKSQTVLSSSYCSSAWERGVGRKTSTRLITEKRNIQLGEFFLSWCRLSSCLLNRHARRCVRACVCARAGIRTQGHTFNWVRMSRRTGGQERCQWCRSHTNYCAAPPKQMEDGRVETPLHYQSECRLVTANVKKKATNKTKMVWFFALSAKSLHAAACSLQWKKKTKKNFLLAEAADQN